MKEKQRQANITFDRPPRSTTDPVGYYSAFSVTPYPESIHEGAGVPEEQNKEELVVRKMKALKQRINHPVQVQALVNEREAYAACFWCTCSFYQQPVCHLYKYVWDDQWHGYGHFCSPECATAYLLKENVDEACRFERLQLLNRVYQGPIKPAPDPFYTLDKYFGTLTIDEFRAWSKRPDVPVLMTVAKPMTRIIPELHDYMEENLTQLKVRRPGDKVQTTVKKQSHLLSTFGFSERK
jgi:hypothetical protein